MTSDIAVRILVIVGDVFVAFAREVQGRVFPAEERTQWNMPDSEASILVDELALEEGHEEDVCNGQDSEEDSKNDSACPSRTKTLDIGPRSLDGDEEGEDRGGESKIEGDKAHSPFEAVLPLEHRIFHCSKDEGGKGS